MTTTALLRAGVVLGWIVLASFALAMGITVPSLQSPVAAGHQLGEQIGRSLATRLAGGG